MFPVISYSMPLSRTILLGAVTLSGSSIMVTSGLLVTSIIAVAIAALLIIRVVNSREVIYAPLVNSREIVHIAALETDNEPQENKEELLTENSSNVLQNILETSEQERAPEGGEENDYYNPIEKSRTPSIYTLGAPAPKKLSFKQPSQKILSLQKKLFTRTDPAPKLTEPPPKLVHFTKGRPQPPGRAPSRKRAAPSAP